MIPKTHHGLDPFACVSAMQKAIRRGLEETAMEMAVEMIHTSKAYFTMVCNRLEVTAHEDVGVHEAIQFSATCIEQAKRHYNAEKIGPARLMIGNAILALCRSKKTRSGTHFAAAIGLENQTGKVPTVPDWAYDVHTMKGRRMGRGLAHFREDGCRLANAIEAEDHYEERAYRQWEKKYNATPELNFNEEER